MKTLTIGQAGTGKTTHLINRYQQYYNKPAQSIILTPTHSSANVLRSKLPPNTLVKTIHSYFRINYITGKILGPKSTPPDTIFIDEVGLIDVNLFEKLWKYIKNSTIHLYGDPLQLNTSIDEVTLTIPKLKRLQVDNNITDYDILAHTAKNILSSKYLQFFTIETLTVNYRSNDFVLRTLNEVLNGNIIINNITDITDIQNYVILASRYKLLDKIMLHFETDYIQSDGLFKHIPIADYYISAVNGKVYHKSEFVDMNQAHPLHYMTIHKSQGKEFDNVIVCLNDLFDPTMLYTAITRAKYNIKFISFGEVQYLKESIDKFTKIQYYIYSQQYNKPHYNKPHSNEVENSKEEVIKENYKYNPNNDQLYKFNQTKGEYIKLKIFRVTDEGNIWRLNKNKLVTKKDFV